MAARTGELQAKREALVADGLATVSQACAFLSVCRKTLYRLMDGGGLAACKIGGARRIPWKALYTLAAKGLDR